MKQSVKIYMNKRLLVMTFAFGILEISIVGWLLYLFTDGFTVSMSRNNSLPFSVLIVVPAIICIICLSTLGNDAHMIFTKDGVEFRRWFHKPEFHPYEHYPYVQKAFYLYYGMPVYHIVLSNWRLTEAQRTDINWVPSSADCIKIRYRKKQYEVLLSVVPPQIASKIRVLFQDIEVSKFDFLMY